MKIYLDKYQKEAVYIKEKNVLVVAAPGSGKTTVIINRVNYLVNELKVRLGNIIIITFTRAAADNMRNRYKNVFNKEIAPFFGTFHGLFYKILLREGFNISIISGGVSHRIIKSVLSKYSDEVSEDKIKEALNNISFFKTSLKAIEEFKPTMAKDIFIECLQKYEEYKSKNGLWDFDDLSVKVISLLRDNPNILLKYRELFKYILVDEFQDCDELQIQFLKMINQENSLFAVGDEDQCIYSFRGSKPEYMVRFDEIFPKAKKIYLSINYRSNENIVEVSKEVIKNNKSRNDKVINSYKDSIGVIKFTRPYDEKIQGDEIAGIIEKSIDDLSDNAVLYRTNMEARSMIDTFTRIRIPFVLLDKGYNFFEHFICKDILSYLKLSINIKDKESFLAIINKPFRYVSKSNLEYIRNSLEDKSPFDILIDKKDTPPYQAKKLDELRRDILYLNKLSLSGAIQYIVSGLNYIDYLKEYGERYNQSIEELEDIIEEFKSAADGLKTIIELLGHVERVKEKIEESKEVQEGVILSTIHGVKGMEFKNVFIINATEETIPHKSSMDENIEEERRLFYVGITRAIDNLYIFSPKTQRGRFKDASRFTQEGGFEDINSNEDYGIKVNDMIHHRAYGDGKVISIDKDVIKIDFGDNLSKSFSLKVLIENNLIIIVN
ncbi:MULTISPECIES: ATP-dependent helicase [Clostridium]|uniref:ATP-dependent helicase n=1 Tax=Clostridium TaxID=1485 RepID=UPI001DC23C95|nr:MULTISPECIES: ATP-dependent helicase [Clostridium]MBS5307965.1 ATP-dependent helicase [Clostridium sp.]MDU1279147.1 ATP-dependent helicase [Clostridium sp.]MDU3348999.1 ATP-dependent helicase [Clostridium sp.]MDU3408541.1 ATP-dependent helicase [Clostridium sp.]MDU3545929.1 ATP-dependent helicase [Clostridium sp.]